MLILVIALDHIFMANVQTDSLCFHVFYMKIVDSVFKPHMKAFYQLTIQIITYESILLVNYIDHYYQKSTFCSLANNESTFQFNQFGQAQLGLKQQRRARKVNSQCSKHRLTTEPLSTLPTSDKQLTLVSKCKIAIS